MGCTATAGWMVTLALWQCWQSLHHSVMSVPMPFQTTLAAISLLVALMPGWARLWMAEKIDLRSTTGISGLGPPQEMSHKRVVPATWMGMRRKEEDIAFSVSTQMAWFLAMAV
jgi:hypothetical protein